MLQATNGGGFKCGCKAVAGRWKGNCAAVSDGTKRLGGGWGKKRKKLTGRADRHPEQGRRKRTRALSMPTSPGIEDIASFRTGNSCQNTLNILGTGAKKRCQCHGA